MTADQLRAECSKFGDVTELRILADFATGISRGQVMLLKMSRQRSINWERVGLSDSIFLSLYFLGVGAGGGDEGREGGNLDGH